MTANNPHSTICQYLSTQHVFTLCTASVIHSSAIHSSAADSANNSENQDLWCASCFYVFDIDKMALWFMTEPETRHGKMMQENRTVAGTIAGQVHDISQIKGIQFRGEVVRLTGDDETVARACYCQHFPIAITAKSPIWQLNLNEIKMVDNTLGFGTKLHWQR